MDEKTVEDIAAAIKESVQKFESPVDLYIRPEAMSRWEKQNPDGDAWKNVPPAGWEIESYRIIARDVLAAVTPTDAEMETADKLRDAMIKTMLALPWAERPDLFASIRYNGIFCCECGQGSVESPNPRCQCTNDE